MISTCICIGVIPVQYYTWYPNIFHGILLFVDVSGKYVCCCGDIYFKTTWLCIRSSPNVISHCFDGWQLAIFFLGLLP